MLRLRTILLCLAIAALAGCNSPEGEPVQSQADSRCEIIVVGRSFNLPGGWFEVLQIKDRERGKVYLIASRRDAESSSLATLDQWDAAGGKKQP